MKILLIGTPNAGKSTLFTELTGIRTTVGNRPGVTVMKKTGNARRKYHRHTVVDLPGIYEAAEEGHMTNEVTDALKNENADLAFLIIDAVSMDKSLRTVLSLLPLHLPTVIVVTRCDMAKKRGISVRKEMLERIFGVPVVLVSARRGEGILQLIKQAETAKRQNRRLLLPTISAREIAFRSTLIKPESGKFDGYFADRLLLHPVFGRLFFLILFAAILFVLTGPPGAELGRITEHVKEAAGEAVGILLERQSVSGTFVGTLFANTTEALFTVFSFLPQVLLLFFAAAYLDLCGILCRFSILADGSMRKIGADGRSAISLLLGFGCTTVGAGAAMAIEEREQREKSVLAVCAVPCSAEVPIILLFSKYLMPSCPFLPAFCAYLFCVGYVFLFFRIFTRERKSHTSFCMELPPLTVPSFREVAGVLSDRIKDVLFRVCGVLFLFSLAEGIILHVLTVSEFTKSNLTTTILHVLTGTLSPFGVKDPRLFIALLSGLFIKEGFLTSFAEMFGENGAFPPLHLFPDKSAAFGYLLLLLLLPPCICALTAIRKAIGSRRIFWRRMFIGVFAAYGYSVICTFLIRLFGFF